MLGSELLNELKCRKKRRVERKAFYETQRKKSKS
jgi:hypothetical protein